MDIGEALGVAKQFKNFFRAAEKLDEFANFILTGQNLLRELEARKKKIEMEIVDLQGQNQEKKKAGLLLDDSLEKKKEEAKLAIKELARDLANRQAEHEAAKSSMAAREKVMLATLEEKEKRVAQKMKDVEEAEQNLDKKKADVESRLAEMRNKLSL